MKTIATINFKGGVGKTTTTWCLGDVVSTNFDATVLLVDLDAQASLTDSIELLAKKEDITDWKKSSEASGQTTFKILEKFLEAQKEFSFQPDNNYIYKLNEKYHFIPSTDDLYWMGLSSFDPEKGRVFVRRLLEKIENSPNFPKYDYVIFDCPPSFTTLSYSVCTCCDLLLVPVNPDFFAAKGVEILLTGLKKRIEARPMPQVAVFANRVKTWRWPTKKSKKWIGDIQGSCERLRNDLDIDVRYLDAWIPDRAAIRDAIANFETPKACISDFNNLWKESGGKLK